jgi:uncharacterized protein involved in exopolysaccharide biosynthesis
MLNPDRNLLSAVPEPVYDSTTLGDVLSAIRQNKLIVSSALILGMVGALGLSKFFPDRYTAQALLIASPAMSRIADLRRETEALQVDPMAIRTIVETLGSIPIIEKAVQSLPPNVHESLAASAATKKNASIPFCPAALCQSNSRNGEPDGAAAGQSTDARAITNYVLHNLKAENGGRSYIIQIQYLASDPEMSAAITNAVVSEYLSFRTEQKQRFLNETSVNLKAKLASLKDELQEAERAAQVRREQVRIQERQSESLTGSQQEMVVSEKADAYAKLRQAEREAQAIASVYEHFLLRQRELEGRYDLPETEVQLLSPAQVPLAPDSVSSKVILGLGGLAGLLVGVSGVTLRFRRKKVSEDV